MAARKRRLNGSQDQIVGAIARRHRVIGLAVQQPPSGLRGATAPLLVEERDAGRAAAVAQVAHPRRVAWATLRPALAAGDQPVDAVQVHACAARCEIREAPAQLDDESAIHIDADRGGLMAFLISFTGPT